MKGRSDDLAAEVGRTIRGARTTLGWSQDDLGRRADVSQSAISRLERGRPSGLDFEDLGRIATAMGGRFVVQIRAPFLEDRARQRDLVHARCIAYVVARLRRSGCLAASEVEISGSAGPGWIDVLGLHPLTGTLLVIEIKTEIHDFGRIQRTLAWYQRGSWGAARRCGWEPRRVIPALIVLDTAVVAAALRANQALAADAFPGRAADLAAVIGRPATAPPMMGASIASIDPLSRRADWLRPTSLDRRRTTPAYADYADIARRLSR